MGRNVWRGAVVAVVIGLAVSGAAAAQERKGGGLRQCFGDEITLEEMEMSCVKAPGGDWEAIDHDSAVTTALPMFFFFALLLALLPAVVGMSLSPDAGVARPVGFAIGLFGSWIGVIGLFLVGQSRKHGTPVIQTGARAPAPGSPGAGPAAGAPAPAPPGSSTVAERLNTLKDLLDQGLITQAEYDERRAAAIEGL